MSQIYTQVRKLAEQFIEPYADELDQKKEKKKVICPPKVGQVS